MLEGIIGKDKTPTPPPEPELTRRSREKSDSSTPERLKTEVLESMKKKKR
jgi:hypothetical protein